MTPKVMLAPVAGADPDRTALSWGFALAKTFNAHLDVLFARPSAGDAVPIVGEGMSSSVVEQMMATADREWAGREAEAQSAFREALRAAGVEERERPAESIGASAAWRDETGREEEVVQRASILADLVVAARPPSVPDDPQFLVTLEAAVLGAGRPVLLVPADSRPPSHTGRTVVIAWRSTSDCAHAVTAARPFLADAARIVILTAATSRTHPARAPELASYLAWHGLDTETRTVEPGTDKVGPALLETAADLGADLLVMGAYGHSRLRELLLGGVTRHIVGHTTLPVLMAH